MGADRLGNRNYALFHLAAYGIVVALVCLSLWHCFRLANAKEHSVLLYLIGFFVAVAMLVRLAYVGEIVRSEDRTGIFLATDVFMSLALMLALVLVLRVSPNAQRPASADDEAKAQQEEA
jgi:MFS family permease